MGRVSALALAFFAIGVLALGSRVARAAPPAAQSAVVTVLSVWTEDADDAADALTQAIRSQVRASPGWSLAEAPQSFETLAIALRCPPKPDAACLQRIGDQLHANDYVWGTAAKQGAGKVDAELHLWARDKPAVDASGTLADTTKDPDDPALRALAARLWKELTGNDDNAPVDASPLPAGPATLVVHAGDGGGTVVVDGVERDDLHAGAARVTVSPGQHTVTVRVPGFRTAPQAAWVAANAERELTFVVTPLESVEPVVHPAPTSGESGVRAKSVLGYAAIAAGAGLLVAAGVEAAAWTRDKSDNTTARAMVPSTVPDVCVYPSPAAQDACRKARDAKDVSVLGWVFGGAGVVLAGTGAWLVISDASRPDAPSETTSRPRPRRAGPVVRLVPEVGLRSQSVALRVSF